MKPLRNILLLFAYLFGILGIGIILWTQSGFFWLPVLALVLVVIAFAIVKTERRHSRIPMAIAVIGLVLGFAIPYIFPPKVDESELEAFEQRIEQDEQAELEELDAIINNQQLPSNTSGTANNAPTNPGDTTNTDLGNLPPNSNNTQQPSTPQNQNGLDSGGELAPLDLE